MPFTVSADAIPFPSTFTLISRSFWRYIPMPILKLVKYIPTKDHTRFRQTLKIIDGFSNTLIQEKTEAVLAGKAENKRDIMSILGALSPQSDIAR